MTQKSAPPTFPTPEEAHAAYLLEAQKLCESFHEPGVARDPRWLRAMDRFDAFVAKQPFVQLGLAIDAFLKRRARPVPPGQEQEAA